MTELVEEQHRACALDVRMPIEELRAHRRRARRATSRTAAGPGKLVLEIYEKTTEAELWGPVFVLDYPKEVSPLARDHRELPGMVERFEGIVAGRELCNAFTELIDPDEQRARFEDAGRAEGRPATTRRWSSTRTTSGPSSTACRPPAARHRHRPPRDAARPTRTPSATSSSSRPCAPKPTESATRARKAARSDDVGRRVLGPSVIMRR